MPALDQITFGVSNLFWRPPGKVVWDNEPMEINPKEVGKRIADARVLAGYPAYSDLAKVLRKPSAKKGVIAPNKETVRQWEAGERIPPWEMLEQLAVVLKMPGEVILFGSRRNAQLREERPHLVYVQPDEIELLTQYRSATEAARQRILGSAKHLAADDPAPHSNVTALRGVQ